jgi:signal transduction histidine kinase
MKWSYVIAFAAGILFFTLLTWSLWWLAGGAVVFVGVWVYQMVSERRYIRAVKTATLENQLREMQARLDKSAYREQQLTRVAEQAINAKKQLLATLNQEIRTPVNGMAGMASLLSDASLSDQQREYIHGIQHCGEQLVAVVNHILVDDLLNIPLIGAEDSQPQEERLDLRATVKDVLDLFAGRAGDTGVTLTSHIDEQIPELLGGDGGRIKQILINLVDNSVKYTSQGEISVDARLLGTKDDGRIELGFLVRDTGSGIPASRIGKIFEGLQPVNPAPQPVLPATGDRTANAGAGGAPKNPGLGLVVCRRLVERMGGSISVQSEPGVGCTFSFRLCLNAVAPHASRPFVSGATAGATTGSAATTVSPATTASVSTDELRRLALKV